MDGVICEMTILRHQLNIAAILIFGIDLMDPKAADNYDIDQGDMKCIDDITDEF